MCCGVVYDRKIMELKPNSIKLAIVIINGVVIVSIPFVSVITLSTYSTTGSLSQSDVRKACNSIIKQLLKRCFKGTMNNFSILISNLLV